MAKHGIVRTDNMSGIFDGADLVTLRYKVAGAETAIDNGCFCTVGAFEDKQREVRAAGTPEADSALDSLALIASEEVDKSKKYGALADFENKAGALLRGYKLRKGHFFSLSAEAFDKAESVVPTVGTSILEAQAGVKGKLVNSATSGSTKIADLVRIEQAGSVTLYVFEIA